MWLLRSCSRQTQRFSAPKVNSVVFITGNQNKADYLATWLGTPVVHRKIALNELQSLDLRAVVEHKARAAYAIIRSPILVEDTALTFNTMGQLPGTFIKWFLEQMSMESICRLVDSDPKRAAHAASSFAYFDGKHLEIMEGSLDGTVPKSPRGSAHFGWNPIFIPHGATQTLGEMNESTFIRYYQHIKPYERLRQFLDSRASG